MKRGIFLSLKWKIAILTGSVFLLLYSFFSYLVYQDVSDDFIKNRLAIQSRYKHIARALTEDSFLVLGQFAELLSVSDLHQQNKEQPEELLTQTLDKNWQQWQFIWGLENAVFFNKQGMLVKQWGKSLTSEKLLVKKVLNSELPAHQIICTDVCVQFVMVPVMANSQLMGVLGVSQSFADTVIEYNRITGSDIGVLIGRGEQSVKSLWPYKISAMTNIKQNNRVMSLIKQQYLIDQLFDKRTEINYEDRSFEVNIFSVRGKEGMHPPFFLIIDDITDEKKAVVSSFKTIWLYGIASLLIALCLLVLTLFFSLRRLVDFSSSLRLLAEKKYDEFRRLLGIIVIDKFGYDELDLLKYTALELTDQLESLEQEVRQNIFQLVDQGEELAAERDFVHQLIDVAPILIFTQNTDGVVLSINRAAVKGIGVAESFIIGNVFDNFIPQAEGEHLFKLAQLRNGKISESFKIDGVLVSSSEEEKQHISWIHSILKMRDKQGSFIILSLGVDISERKKIENKMLNMATHDQLTGLSNRRDFQIEFSKHISAAKRYGTELALFYLDLDQFKIVNDTEGHEVGDDLLKLVAKTLQGVVRETDTLSRIGGDEFTLIMPNSEKQGVTSVAEKINQSLKSLDFWVGEKYYEISTSIGIAMYPIHGRDEHELLSNADLAMYQAKDSGRGHFHVFSLDNDYQSKLTTRLHWKNIIEKALEHDKFILLFQPILDIRMNQVSHFECLSRIQNDDGSFIMPSEFIGFAEELGLIGKIDRLALKKTIEQLLVFKKQGKHYKLAVNFSGRSFSDESIFEDVKKLLGKFDVEPDKIIFELTETATVSNFSAAKSLIIKLKSLGCSIALDDFGVGFSSFYYLKYLPVDYVKIDGAFIKHLQSNEDDKVFVKALTEVSQALGKKTVAEFVENAVVLEQLKEFGVDYAQGYYIGKPARLN